MRTHVEKMRTKLGVNTRAALAAKASSSDTWVESTPPGLTIQSHLPDNVA